MLVCPENHSHGFNVVRDPAVPGDTREVRWQLFKAISDWCEGHQHGPDDEGDNPVKAAVDAYVAALRAPAGERPEQTVSVEWVCGELERFAGHLRTKEGDRSGLNRSACARDARNAIADTILEMIVPKIRAQAHRVTPEGASHE